MLYVLLKNDNDSSQQFYIRIGFSFGLADVTTEKNFFVLQTAPIKKGWKETCCSTKKKYERKKNSEKIEWTMTIEYRG